MGLWERIPKPVRHCLDVGRILHGLHGIYWVWGIVVSGLVVAVPFVSQLPLGATVALAISGTAFALAVFGHVGAYLKDRQERNRIPSSTFVLPQIDRNLSTTMGHSTGLIREQCPVW